MTRHYKYVCIYIYIYKNAWRESGGIYSGSKTRIVRWNRRGNDMLSETRYY